MRVLLVLKMLLLTDKYQEKNTRDKKCLQEKGQTKLLNFSGFFLMVHPMMPTLLVL